MPNTEQAPTKESYTLVTFQWGTPPTPATTVRLTNANANLDTSFGLFLSDGKLSVKLPKNSIAGLSKSEAIVDISTSAWAFAPQITEGRPFPPTSVKIQEKTVNETDDNIRTVFLGTMSVAVRNPVGKTGLVRVKSQGAKNDLEQSLGFSTNDICGWVFGDLKTCGLDLSPLVESGPLTIINNTEVTVTGLAAHPNRYWRRGFIERDGLRIRIREWQSGTTFFLSRLPPLNWDTGQGADVNLTPGCDKSITVCRFWDREISFSGIGFAMQDYNPLFENPTQ